MSSIRTLVLLLVFSLPTLLYGQQSTIRGTIKDAQTGEALVGATVLLVDIARGNATDIDGIYLIDNVPYGEYTVRVSFIGYVPIEEVLVVNSATTSFDVSLSPDLEGLEEVVVTAAGIKRQAKALGFGVTKIEGEKLVPQAEADVSRILRGKAPGVNITSTSGTSGAATNIIIRGYTSITGSNQPLFIVDGVPFDGGTNNQDGFATVQTSSSRFLDIDPNNISSVNVLKGLAATVLYGDRGRNGVILIETKTGTFENVSNKKMEVSINQSVAVNEIASLPDYNRNYGNGFQATNAATFFSNWGGSITDTPTIPHPYSTSSSSVVRDGFPEFAGQDYNYQFYNSVPNFFRRGTVTNTSVDVSGTSKRLDYGVTYSNNMDQGFTPGNELNKDVLNVGGTYRLLNNFTVTSKIMFSNTDVVSPPISASRGSSSGSGLVDSVFGDLFYTPTTIDLMGLPFQSPLNGASVYYRGGNDIQNPRWTVENAFSNSQVRRTFTTLTATYEPVDWATITYRYGQDSYDEDQQLGQQKGGVGGNVQGIYRTTAIRSQILNHELNAQVIRNISDDITFNGVIGAQFRRDVFENTQLLSQNQIAFGVMRHFNFTDYSGSDFLSEQNRFGIYGQAEIGYKDYLFLTVSARNDWTSTLETGNNAQLYPSVTLAADLTNAIEGLKSVDWLTYLKVRASYGSSANFPGPYSTRNQLALNSRAFVDATGAVITSNLVSNQLGNPDLEPELVEEVEFGIEANLFNNRIRTEISYYQKNTNNLLLNQLLDPGTGFTATQINAGELESKGLEVDLSFTPVQTRDFSWEVNSNFFTDANLVVSLPEGTNQIQTSGYTDIGNFQVVGKPFNLLRGEGFERNENGEILIDPGTGNALTTQDIIDLGNPNAKFTTSIFNTFNYKNFTFAFDVEYRHGGKIYSQTATTMMARGVTADTDFDRRESYIINGVRNDNGQPNDIIITATNYYFNHYLTPEGGVFDGTTIRLNNLTLSYRVPTKYLESTPFGSLSFSAFGNNIWFKAINMPEHVNFDTNVLGVGVGNAQGLDFLNGPSRKSYGVSARLTF